MRRTANVDKMTNAASQAALEEAPSRPLVWAGIADATALRSVSAAQCPDAATHLAAESHADHSIDAPGGFIQTNVVGTFVLLEEADATGLTCRRPRVAISASTTSPPTRCLAPWRPVTLRSSGWRAMTRAAPMPRRTRCGTCRSSVDCSTMARGSACASPADASALGLGGHRPLFLRQHRKRVGGRHPALRRAGNWRSPI